MRLFANEFLKIRRSKSVKILFGVFLAFIILSAYAGNYTGSAKMRSGFAGPFLWNGIMGAAGLFAYGALAAGMVAGEFQLGVVQNALGCGVSRRRYFVVKVISVLGISAVLYLLCTCIFTGFLTEVYGFDPERILPSEYRLKVLAFTGAALAVQLSCVSMYICFAYLFRKASATFAASVLATLLETFVSARLIKADAISGNGINGPFTTTFLLSQHFVSDTILTREFALLTLPCIGLMAISLLASYFLFMKRSV